MTAKKKPAPEVEAPIVAYKGFDSNMQCRGFQYEVGQHYVHNGPVRQCDSGFHVCQNPLDVLDFYGLEKGNRFAKVTVGGMIDRGDNKKWSAAELTVEVELKLPDLIGAAIQWVLDACKAEKTDEGDSSQLAASGDSSQLAASGDSSKLAASGNYSKLAASGDYSKLAASGYYSKLEVTGINSAAAAVGPNSTVKATAGTPVAICEYDDRGAPIGFATGIAGVDGIPADVWLKAKGGKLVPA